MGKNIHLFLVLTLVEEGPFQLEFLSHLGQLSYFHFGKFQCLCTGAAILPPPPIIRLANLVTIFFLCLL